MTSPHATAEPFATALAKGEGFSTISVTRTYSAEMTNWTPQTLEDRLLQKYLDDHPGELFLELNVGAGDASHGPRRLDGLLIPGETTRVHPPDAYTTDSAAAAIAGQAVHLLEAKRALNRNVIGQVEVGTELLKRDFAPTAVVPVAVCGDGNRDLEWYCQLKEIRAAIYPLPSRPPEPLEAADEEERLDVRQPPDPARRAAFLRGWDAAVEGSLYSSITSRKTHANMGNLFGWIYGDRPEAFRIETWERYVEAGWS